jgi:Na+-translocating ferredoxin:NAD+ oxidoreductase subunit B
MIPKPPVPIAYKRALSDQARAIDAVLPQTQCQRCGYPACADYAEAIAEGEAAINQCPPGGELGIKALARLTGQAVTALNVSHGEITPLALAVIDEAICIGCTLCLQACPVDAIIGANKRLHTVLADECSGCELCLAVCPVDCISMQSAASVWQPVSANTSARWREAHQAHLTRYWEMADTPELVPVVDKLAAIKAALAKAQQRL